MISSMTKLETFERHGYSKNMILNLLMYPFTQHNRGSSTVWMNLRLNCILTIEVVVYPLKRYGRVNTKPYLKRSTQFCLCCWGGVAKPKFQSQGQAALMGDRAPLFHGLQTTLLGTICLMVPSLRHIINSKFYV